MNLCLTGCLLQPSTNCKLASNTTGACSLALSSVRSTLFLLSEVCGYILRGVGVWLYIDEFILEERDNGTNVPLLLHVEYWLTLLLCEIGLGDREVSKLLGTWRFASSAIEPVSTEADDVLLL